MFRGGVMKILGRGSIISRKYKRWGRSNNQDEEVVEEKEEEQQQQQQQVEKEKKDS